MNITASIKGVIQRGIAQVNVKDGHLFVTLTDGTYLDLGVVAGRGITDAAIQTGRLVLTFTDGTTKDVGVVAGRSIVKAEVKSDNLILTFSDGTTQDVGSVRGRGLSHADLDGDNLILVYTDGATQNVGSVKGRGIQSIAKTGTAGKVDTYTVTYTDGSTWSYTVQNGNDAAFDGTLKGDFRLQGGAFRFQSSAGKDLLTLSATTDRDGTIRLGNANQPIRMGAIASPQTDTDAVNKGYVDRLLSDSINTIDSLIGGNV